jgi:hypothetical protein
LTASHMTRAIFGQCCGAVGIPEQWGSRWPPCAPVHVFGSWSYTMDTVRLQIVPQLRFDIPRFVLIIACSERAHRGMSGQFALRSHLHVWYSPVCVRRGHMSGNCCSLHAVSLEGIRLCGIRRDSSLSLPAGTDAAVQWMWKQRGCSSLQQTPRRPAAAPASYVP